MQNANMDTAIYDYYNNFRSGTNTVNVKSNGEVYNFEFDLPNVTEGPSQSSTDRNATVNMMLEEYYAEPEEVDETPKVDFYQEYFDQRPDVQIVYDDLKSNIENYTEQKNKAEEAIVKIERLKEKSADNDYSEEYDKLLAELEVINSKLDPLQERLDTIITDIYEFNNLTTALEGVELAIAEYGDDPNRVAKLQSVNNQDGLTLEELQAKKQRLIDEIFAYQSRAITLDDVSEQVNGYNSAYGTVPAGEWDCWKNPLYEGTGYVTGLIGSFEGPHGKETGYDSRKGAEKENYKAPDTTLLDYLSAVTDAEGNLLYPKESFEKGGKYYYHIFGVNDDGTINWKLINNPRFGCKMLGNYLIVGGDQRLKRSRGSLIMTSLGPAIQFDCGDIDDLEADPNHIDISMDEVLFWLSNFSHNQDLNVETLCGIYEWCTTKEYDGTIDEAYEIMERNYVNNLNTYYNANCICVFDRDDFENETNFEDQNDFVYQLTFRR